MKTKIGIPIGLALVMFLGVFTAMLALGTLSPEPTQAQASASATRSFDMSRVDPSGSLTVTLAVTGYGTAGGVTEMLPAGFTYVSSNLDDFQVTEVDAQTVRFTLQGETSFTYTVTAPSTVGDYTFSGTLRDADRNDHVVGGETMVMVSTMSVPGAPTGLMAVGHGDHIDLSWTAPADDGGAAITGYSIQYSMDGSSWSDLMGDHTTSTKTSTYHGGLMPSTTRHYQVAAINEVGMGPYSDSASATTEAGPAVTDVSVTNRPNEPGAAAQYTVMFKTGVELAANTDTITFDIDSSVGVPSTIAANAIRISASMVSGGGQPNQSVALSLDPSRQDGSEGRDIYTITVPDMDARESSGIENIARDAMVTVTFLTSAGLTNPTEQNLVTMDADGNRTGGGDDFKVKTSKQTEYGRAYFSTPLEFSSDDAADNRDKPLTVQGKGFKNGTTAIVYLDKNMNNMRDAGDVDLWRGVVESNDTFTATFNVTVPPFVGNLTKNRINAIDGENPPNHYTDGPTFVVEGLLQISPGEADIGEDLDITLTDWPSESVTKVEIAGIPHEFPATSVDADGSADFSITIRNDVPSGVQQVKVYSARENDTQNIVISSADLDVNPNSAVPNQAITVTGRGFTDGQKILGSATDGSVVAIGKETKFLEAGDTNFNNGQEIEVDSSGSWSATIILPITSITTTPGTHVLEIKDSDGRSGGVGITIPERTLTIEPAEARPGEMVTLTGTGFPASNSRSKEQGTPPVRIEYDGTLVGSATPDGEGNIRLSFRVPLDAGIPSSNEVEAIFEYVARTSEEVSTSTDHEVPGARISLSMDEGKPGDRVTITGDGFKAFASVEMVEIGGIEVTPAPRPATDRNGEFTATILVPDLSEGTNAIKAKVGDTTATANFKVLDTETPRMMIPAAEAATPADAFADLIAEDNLVRVWHFNKHDQDNEENGGWTLYDTREAFMALNTIEMIEPGETYFLMVNNEQLNIELGSERHDLVAGLNIIRW